MVSPRRKKNLSIHEEIPGAWQGVESPENSTASSRNVLATPEHSRLEIVPGVVVQVNFSPAEDQVILVQMAQGKHGRASDLYLRRQALAVSLSPGFDTLLSLKVVRGIEPLDYQLATVRHVLKNLRGRALLCDEVGMGKTIEAGLILMEYLMRGLVRRVLVLTPPSLVEQWQQEMQTKFNLDFISYDNQAFKSHPHPWREFPRIIASLDTAKRETHRDEVLAAEFDMVIVDEAHHLKNRRTQAYRLVSQLKKKYILLLTATPVENDLEELFNLITLLQPGQLETAASFKRKYITRGDPLKPKNADDLKRLVREVMVRNRRSETSAIRSRRRADIIELSLSDDEMAFYNRLSSLLYSWFNRHERRGQPVYFAHPAAGDRKQHRGGHSYPGENGGKSGLPGGIAACPDYPGIPGLGGKREGQSGDPSQALATVR